MAILPPFQRWPDPVDASEIRWSLTGGGGLKVVEKSHAFGRVLAPSERWLVSTDFWTINSIIGLHQKWGFKVCCGEYYSKGPWKIDGWKMLFEAFPPLPILPSLPVFEPHDKFRDPRCHKIIENKSWKMCVYKYVVYIYICQPKMLNTCIYIYTNINNSLYI